MERHYIFNLESTKIELEFDKEEYAQFSQEQKKNLKSAFLFSGKSKRWVSRAKEPNLYRAKEVAKTLGFTEEMREGERLSYAEQLTKKAERAEARADRYEGYAENATSRAEALQKPLKQMSGDIAFFTQPIIPGHSGSQAFANYREKIYAKYEKGFNEYRKSDYFLDRAATARETASMEQLNDKAFIDRRIKECRKEIRDRKKNIEHYEKILLKLETGETVTAYNGTAFTVEAVSHQLYNQLELIDVAQDKEGYLLNRLDELGGLQFSRDNIQVGYIVTLNRWGLAEVTGKGPVNIRYKILTGGAAGFGGTAAYAEIQEIKKAEPKKAESHPFTVGETFIANKYVHEDNNLKKIKTTYKIVKVSDKTIQLKEVEAGQNQKPITRKPSKTYNGTWCFAIDDSYGNSFYKSSPNKM